MSKRERIERIIAVAEESTNNELDLLMDLLQERSDAEEPTKPKRGRPKKKKDKRDNNKKYSDKQIVKAVKLRKQGVTKAETARRTGIKEGSLTNTKWLMGQFENIQKNKR